MKPALVLGLDTRTDMIRQAATRCGSLSVDIQPARSSDAAASAASILF